VRLPDTSIYFASGGKKAMKNADSAVRRYFHRALSLRDPGTGDHTQHVGEIAESIGAQMGCSPHAARAIFVGSVLHDVGKLGTPDVVLQKKGLFDDQDLAIIRIHCQDGFDILRGRVMHEAALVALWHHERYDGTGYPSGMAADEIAGRRGAWFDPFVVDAFLRAAARNAFNTQSQRGT
jgi:HD-GYP domain-containing protein (c-di-GMP phosphodiesterase class II)